MKVKIIAILLAFLMLFLAGTHGWGDNDDDNGRFDHPGNDFDAAWDDMRRSTELDTYDGYDPRDSTDGPFWNS